ncbi:hypothetical protein CBR_g37489 [Chara braunii]|uniref:PHD-type domain-containing protein n=1 Tax=Chara braunii TaxID=69332 RepID=A0A388LMZ3_CHABU|nr:hypothetical protein CBR_g37489 [Chara braunii]|eukprot:GBG83688.1 hypothetical protein CBR_g37489 [Chara braunii]
MKMTQLCSNPHCKRTSPGDGPTCRWHVRNYGSEEEPKNVTLCNACKINFDQGKYCPFCVQIYREKDPDSFDGKEWVGCDNRSCRRWVHVECEIKAGHSVDSSAFYLCPTCRETTQDLGDRRRPSRQAHSEARSVEEDAGGDIQMEDVSVKGGSPSNRIPRRPLRVDLSRLETSSLRKYKKVYKLRDVAGGCKKMLAVLTFAEAMKINPANMEIAVVQPQLLIGLRREWEAEKGKRRE